MTTYAFPIWGKREIDSSTLSLWLRNPRGSDIPEVLICYRKPIHLFIRAKLDVPTLISLLLRKPFLEISFERDKQESYYYTKEGEEFNLWMSRPRYSSGSWMGILAASALRNSHRRIVFDDHSRIPDEILSIFGSELRRVHITAKEGCSCGQPSTQSFVCAPPVELFETIEL